VDLQVLIYAVAMGLVKVEHQKINRVSKDEVAMLLQ